MSNKDDSNDEPTIVRSQVVLGGKSSEFAADEEDAISPTAIHHYVDEMPGPESLAHRYNYYVYIFERDGFSYQARAYVEFIEEVSIMVPRNRRDIDRSDEEEAFRRNVLQYLKRRFHRIQELGNEGYKTVWERSQ